MELFQTPIKNILVERIIVCKDFSIKVVKLFHNSVDYFYCIWWHHSKKLLKNLFDFWPGVCKFWKKLVIVC